jgi:hypothetical protein
MALPGGTGQEGGNAKDKGGEGGDEGDEDEDLEFAIDGPCVLWKYRSQRRRWRGRVRHAVTLPCVAISTQELHERASAAGIAGVPASLIARNARPWAVAQGDGGEDEGGLPEEDGGAASSDEEEDGGDDMFDVEEDD